MTRVNVILLSLLSIPVALAAPKHAKRFGTAATEHAYSTGSPYGFGNGTTVGPTGMGTGTAAAPMTRSTVVVSPLPVSSSDPSMSAVAPLSFEETLSPSDAPELNACGPATVTVTASGTVTVTVGVESDTAAAVLAISTPVESGLPSSSYASSPFGNGTTVGPIGPTGTAAPIAQSSGTAYSSSYSQLPLSGHGYKHLSLHHHTSQSSYSTNSSTMMLSSGTAAPALASSVVSSSSTWAEYTSTPDMPPASSVDSSSETAAAGAASTSTQPYVAPSVPVSESAAPMSPSFASEYAIPSASVSESAAPMSISSTAEYVAPSSETAAPLQPSSTPEYAAPSAPLSVTAAPLQPSSSSAPAATSSASSSGQKGVGGRGLVYNDAKLTDCFSASKITWVYNWDSQPGGNLPSNFQFVPMLWGLNGIHTNRWNANAQAAIDNGATHLLSFNEPDMGSQAHLSGSDAAAGHIKYMNPFHKQAKIGSPAVTQANNGMGLEWLKAFDTACAGQCIVDFVNVHWYGWANAAVDLQVKVFQEFVTNATVYAGGKPVWVTEFQADPTSSQDKQNAFMKQVLPWLDQQPGVERYAWQMLEQGNLAAGTGMSQPLGQTYASV
ncbi:hypothetical protein MMC24_001367 [Lignoscripta atroalba]|nr:hypothetical protein [Lignoscripta atroalba]